MRVLLLTNLFPPDVLGGYELLAADVARELRARHHDVHVLTSGPFRPTDPPWVHRDLSLIRPFEEPASLDRLRHAAAAGPQARAVARLMRRERFDVVLVMSLRRLGMHVPRWLSERGVPMVFCFNDDWLLAHRPAPGASALTRAVWRLVEHGPLAARTWAGVQIERAVYVSAATRAMLTRGGAPVPEGLVAFQGVDRLMFPPREPRPMAAAPRLVFAGRLHPTKGVDVAIQALAALRGRGVMASLTVAGTGAVDERARLEGLAAQLGVASVVEFAGFVPREQLAALYAQHDVFLFPSLWEEPAGLTYLEAMSVGLPVVALANGGAKELLRTEENCLVATNADTMAAGVARLLDDLPLQERLVAGGFRTVSKEASLGGYIDSIELELRSAAQAVPGRDGSSRDLPQPMSNA